MVGSGKTLTVSYGTFSCTVEGFDDPVATMQRVADYFRDLSRQDVVFDETLDIPSAETLVEIADGDADRDCHATVTAGAIHLRQVGGAAASLATTVADNVELVVVETENAAAKAATGEDLETADLTELAIIDDPHVRADMPNVQQHGPFAWGEARHQDRDIDDAVPLSDDFVFEGTDLLLPEEGEEDLVFDDLQVEEPQSEVLELTEDTTGHAELLMVDNISAEDDEGDLGDDVAAQAENLELDIAAQAQPAAAAAADAAPADANVSDETEPSVEDDDLTADEDQTTYVFELGIDEPQTTGPTDTVEPETSADIATGALVEASDHGQVATEGASQQISSNDRAPQGEAIIEQNDEDLATEDLATGDDGAFAEPQDVAADLDHDTASDPDDDAMLASEVFVEMDEDEVVALHDDGMPETEQGDEPASPEMSDLTDETVAGKNVDDDIDGEDTAQDLTVADEDLPMDDSVAIAVATDMVAGEVALNDTEASVDPVQDEERLVALNEPDTASVTDSNDDETDLSEPSVEDHAETGAAMPEIDRVAEQIERSRKLTRLRTVLSREVGFDPSDTDDDVTMGETAPTEFAETDGSAHIKVINEAVEDDDLPSHDQSIASESLQTDVSEADADAETSPEQRMARITTVKKSAFNTAFRKMADAIGMSGNGKPDDESQHLSEDDVLGEIARKAAEETPEEPKDLSEEVALVAAHEAARNYTALTEEEDEVEIDPEDAVLLDDAVAAIVEDDADDSLQDTVAEDETDDDADPSLETDEVLRRARSRFARIALLDDPAPSEPEPAAEETPDPQIEDIIAKLAKSEAAAERRTAVLERGEHEEDRVNRLLDRTNSQLAGPENKRRRSAIAHLKAAVLATKAEGKGRIDTGDSPEKQYRDDLAKVVRPSRILAESEMQSAEADAPDHGAKSEEPVPEDARSTDLLPEAPQDDPLSIDAFEFQGADRDEEDEYEDTAPLVMAEDRPSETTAELVDDEPAVKEPSPLMLVPEPAREQETAPDLIQPRRVAKALGSSDERPTAEPIAADADGYQDFVSRARAANLQDLLECGAAYLVMEEGHPHFTHPDIMALATGISGFETTTREQSLRAFGQLLRQGKIRKVTRGQFTVSQSSRYIPTAQSAAN